MHIPYRSRANQRKHPARKAELCAKQNLESNNGVPVPAKSPRQLTLAGKKLENDLGTPIQGALRANGRDSNDVRQLPGASLRLRPREKKYWPAELVEPSRLAERGAAKAAGLFRLRLLL